MSSARTRRATVDRSPVPKVACFNQATVPLGVDLDRLLRALQTFVDRCVAPVWGTPANLVRSTGFVRGMWALVFRDKADRRGQVAYHDLTPDGFPVAKVFVTSARESGRSLSAVASHELVEMLVDPAINLWSRGKGRRTLYAYEAADPVDGLEFKINGLPMADFVYPSYFEGFRTVGSAQFDYLDRVRRPFRPVRDGYQIVLRSGQKRVTYGSRRGAKRFRQEDRSDRRSTNRDHKQHTCAPPPWGRSLGAVRKRG
jgi:hypothetical protein